MIKLGNVMIVQDSLEDEYFNPIVKVGGEESKEFINTGLWTSFSYDPRGLAAKLESDSDFDSWQMTSDNLQVRKRLVGKCLKTGTRFIVAIYKNFETEEEWEKWRQETFKMNSLHSFIGIIEHFNDEHDQDGEIESENKESTTTSINEEESGSMATLPVVHLIHRSSCEGVSLCKIEPDCFSQIRSNILAKFTELFGGNGESAEALLLCLISRPVMRVNGLIDSLFIGKLTLNICLQGLEQSHSSPIASFVSMLKLIKPFVAGPIDPTSASFSTDPLYPILNPQNGQFSESILQQSEGCVVVVDESAVVEGEFKDQAVKNLQSLIDLITHQQIPHDCGMQQVMIGTEMPIITVSKNGKSILPADLRVNCERMCPVSLEVQEAEDFKAYLEMCRGLTCVIGEEMAEYLEKDYLNLRKASPVDSNGNPKMNEQEFHKIINLARLKALSHASTTLSETVWSDTKAAFLKL